MTAVHLVSLGCSRNDVDSEEVAARLANDGFTLTSEPDQADVIVVNTCGFIEQAKKDSIDTLLAASDHKAGRAKAVVAIGCLAERYGQDLARVLPEADAVLGFDSYPQIAERLRRILDGERMESHLPSDRRRLLPLSPVERPTAAGIVPGHGDLLPGQAPASGPILRYRLDDACWAPLKIASGCDRRCTFCAIPAFRGSYLSRSPADIVAEAEWLVGQGVKEVLLVSENTSSYGKDLPTGGGLEHLLTALNRVDGLEWLRVSYLQPAEMRPSIVETMAALDKVVPYFDLSFQHASPTVLRRMRRFGGAEHFLSLIERARSLIPRAGFRSNVIVGFPGETDQDVAVLKDFLSEARLDAVGVFGYSDEEGTVAAELDDHLDSEVIDGRQGEVGALVDELCDQRAAERVGETTRVLVESLAGGRAVGRAMHQGPEVDGQTSLSGEVHPAIGEIVEAVVVGHLGVDLEARIMSGEAS